MSFKQTSQSAVAALWIAMATVPASAQEPKRLIGADLFIDLQEYVGKQVILIDGTVWGASENGAIIKAGGVAVTLWMSVEDIDRESFRFFLTNCTGLSDFCKFPLLVTPTVTRYNGWPVLKSVKIAK
jgi:hypothetical protein